MKKSIKTIAEFEENKLDNLFFIKGGVGDITVGDEDDLDEDDPTDDF